MSYSYGGSYGGGYSGGSLSSGRSGPLFRPMLGMWLPMGGGNRGWKNWVAHEKKTRQEVAADGTTKEIIELNKRSLGGRVGRGVLAGAAALTMIIGAPILGVGAGMALGLGATGQMVAGLAGLLVGVGGVTVMNEAMNYDNEGTTTAERIVSAPERTV